MIRYGLGEHFMTYAPNDRNFYDADSHVMELPNFIIDYADKEFKDLIPPVNYKASLVTDEEVEEIVNNSKPRYIGFLEYRYMPSVTSAVASEGFKGVIVVLYLANNLKEGNTHANPIIRTNTLNEP